MSKNLKIAIIGSRGYPYVYSGYETLVKELSERLVKKGHRVRVYCHSSLFKKRPKQIKGIELIYTPSIETKFLSQFINSFFSFFHVCFSNIDIVFVVNSANGPFGLLTKLFNKKTCINVDGLEWLRPKWIGLGALYFKLSSKLSTLLFDRIITDSIEMKKIYSMNFSRDSINIAYGSTMLKTKKNDLLNEIGLEKKSYYLIVGRLIPDNNAKLIIKSFLNSNSKKKLLIVGDVPYNDKYSKEVKSMASENIIFLGYVKSQINLSQLYINSFGYIHGHEFGGTNPTMINALDLNCQILALKTVFNFEMLKNKKSVFFDKNQQSIIKAINIFEANIDDIIYSNINYKIPNKYKWNEIVNSYIKVFYELNYQKNKKT